MGTSPLQCNACVPIYRGCAPSHSMLHPFTQCSIPCSTPLLMPHPPPPQVNCQSVDSSFNPTKGKTLYDPALHRAEFTPFNTLFPNSKYMVTLNGRAVTTSQCSNPANIKNTDFHFTTCNPAPKTISVKLRGHSSEVGGALRVDATPLLVRHVL